VELFLFWFELTMSPKPRRPAKRTTLWIALIAVLMVLDTGLLLILLASFRMPAAPQPVAQITATPTPAPGLTATRAPRRPTPRTLAVPSPVVTRRPTRTPRPRLTVIPTPTGALPFATPSGQAGRCHETTGQIVDDMYRSGVNGTDQNFIVYLPPCYDATTRRYPVLYLIHGAYDDDTHWESLGLFEAMDRGLQAGRLAPAIIVLPSSDQDLYTNTSGGADSYESQIVDELVPLVDSLYRTDARPEMRAIGGISRGGVWSLEIGFDQPRIFGIVAGHSACLNLNESPVEYDPLKMTEAITLKFQRLWLDAGDEDECLPGTQDLHAALEASGVAHEYHVWPGIHQDPYWAGHLDDYLAFYTATWPRS
jgi:enterochelin esterase-like enzyme